ncbi:MAG: hypothetical protein KQH63_00205 [Desulfobulbaceae bacterium]|nr:hypothetical protein [Desulfobulbaceae bacterium]
MYVKIDKESFEVVIMTESLKIVGTIYTLPQERLIDFMSDEQVRNLPVTDASVYTLQEGTLIAKTKFLSLNRQNIALIFPASDAIE